VTFYEIITAAIKDFEANGFDSQQRLEYWTAEIRKSCGRAMISPEQLQALLNHEMQSIYVKQIEKGGALKLHSGVSRFTIDKLKPKLHRELYRRIMASANLIKLNREASIQRTLQRFSGWATSIPAGGSKAVDKPEVKANLRKALAQLPFEERRVIIDQGHKFVAELNNIIATDGGAIAMKWHSHFRQPGYNYRPDHKERDSLIYLIRDSWAREQGLVKPGKAAGYSDQITKPAEEPFCRCFATYIYNPASLPDDMLTVKGKKSLAAAKAKLKAIMA
jgi:hypothetical protein